MNGRSPSIPDEDDFHVKWNGAEVYSGTFSMGGGPTVRPVHITNPYWATTTTTVTPVGGGGLTTIHLPLTFLPGANSVEFSYSGNNEGMAHQGWCMNQTLYNFPIAPAPTPAPTPGTTPAPTPAPSATYAPGAYNYGESGVLYQRAPGRE